MPVRHDDPLETVVTGHYLEPELRRRFLPEFDFSAADLEIERDGWPAPDSVYRALADLQSMLDAVEGSLVPVLPAVLRGRLLLPEAAPASSVFLRLEPAGEDGDAADWATARAVTGADGGFEIALPPLSVPDEGLVLVAVGLDEEVRFDLPAAEVDLGDVGTLILERPVGELPEALASRLMRGLVDPDDALAFATARVSVGLAEGDCARIFRSNTGAVERFRWGTLVRLVEPSLKPRTPTKEVAGTRLGFDGTRVGISESTSLDWYIARKGASRTGDRVPVHRPLDLSELHRRLGVEPEEVPQAATLSLGYVVWMAQSWQPVGLALGDLVFSLSLAPGESRRLVVHEREEVLRVRDGESLQVSETQAAYGSARASAEGVFRRALADASEAGSWSAGRSSQQGMAWGLSFLGIGVGGGGSFVSGSAEAGSLQRRARDLVASASERVAEAVRERARLARSAVRASVRLAGDDDRERVSTRLVRNHNRTRALTLQYWEVLRRFRVTEEVDDVRLVVMVPMAVIRWLPKGAPELGAIKDWRGLVQRYGQLVRHAAVLRPLLAGEPRLRRGLDVLLDLVSHPEVELPRARRSAEVPVRVSVRGTFLPCDRVMARVVRRDGRAGAWHRLYPVRRGAVSEGWEAWTERDLVDRARERRQDVPDGWTEMAVEFALSREVMRAGIARVELRHTFEALVVPRPAVLGGVVRISAEAVAERVGPPRVWRPEVGFDGVVESLSRAGPSGAAGARPMPGRWSLVPREHQPEIGIADVDLIEELLQHVMADGVRCSRAVWASLSEVERAILLEPYTVGIPRGGAPPGFEEVPLLDCVENRLLGFFGNSMVLPFHVPPKLARQVGLSSAKLQARLLQFHETAFRRRSRVVDLPTRGVLGEAVLGACTSAERIDLTRFWNWKDAPMETAEAVAGAAGALAGDSALAPEGSAAAATGLAGLSRVSEGQFLAALARFAEAGLAARLRETAARGVTGDAAAAALAGATAEGTVKEAAFNLQAVQAMWEKLAKESAIDPSKLLEKLASARALEREVDQLRSRAGDAQLGERLARVRSALPGFLELAKGKADDPEALSGLAGEFVRDTMGAGELSVLEKSGVQALLSGVGEGAPAAVLQALQLAFGLL